MFYFCVQEQGISALADLYILHFYFCLLSLTLQLALVSLSLIRTLVDLNCEDLMLQLVFRYNLCNMTKILDIFVQFGLTPSFWIG